jgi:hypothetical protein
MLGIGSSRRRWLNQPPAGCPGVKVVQTVGVARRFGGCQGGGWGSPRAFPSRSRLSMPYLQRAESNAAPMVIGEDSVACRCQRRTSRIVFGRSGIPSLEQRAERAVKRPCSSLQQEDRGRRVGRRYTRPAQQQPDADDGQLRRADLLSVTCPRERLCPAGTCLLL